VHYFKNMYLPFLDGSPLLFRDMGRDEYAGSMFSPNYFSSHCENFRHIVDDINVFRSNNAGYRVTKNDVKRSLKGEIVLPEQAALIIRFVGDFFYGVGNELQYWYDSHRLWASSRSKPAYPDLSHTSIMDRDLDSQNAQGRPIPYYNCVIKEVKNRTPLMNEVLGKRVLEDSLRDGVYVQLNAFAYQVAYECHNGSLLRDLDDMKSVRKMIVQEMQ
jgi:hypothetical protein